LLELRDRSFTPALYRVLEGQSSYYEGFYEATTGKAKLWLSLRLSPLRDVNGEVVGGMGIVEDISERMQNEKQLHLHKTALEAAANGIVITDREGTIVWVNPAVTHLTGYSAEELIGKNPRIFKSGKQDNDLYQNLWNTIISGEVWKGEMVNRRKDGSLYIEEMTITPVRFGGGGITHFIAVKQDVTQRKQSEEATKESDERFQVVSRATNDAVWDWDLKTNQLWYNENIQNLFGYPFDKVGTDVNWWIENLHPEDKEGVVSSIYEVIYSDESYWSREYRYRCFDGHYAYVFDRGYVIRDNLGKPTRMIGSMMDITERKQVEEAIKEGQERLELALKGGELGLWDWNIQTGEMEFNERWAEMLGYSPDEIKKHISAWKNMVHPDDIPYVIEILDAHLEGRLPFYEAEYRIKCKNGDLKWILDRGRVFERDKDGKPVRATGTFLDITERKRAEELIKSHVRLQTAIARLGQIALAETDLPNLMNEVVSLVAQTLEVEYCKVLELLPDGQAFILRAGVGWKEGCVGHSILGTETESQAGYTLLSGGPVVVEDLRTEKRFNGPPLLHDHQVLSGISVIIAGHNRHFGVLGAHSTRLRKFTSDDISFLQTVANVLAEAIERKLSEEKIREQATLLDVARDAIMVRDLEHRITYWNRSAERLYGWTAEEAIGKNALGLLFRGEVSPVFEAHKSVIEKGEWTGELHQITKDGREITVDSHWSIVRDEEGKPKSIFIVNTDITEKKRLESEFLRSQRMESIGTLAGGIAHDLNNVFQPIMMVLQLLRMRFSDEKSIGLIETLEASAERGANLVKQVLSFARGTEGEHSIIQVRHIISEIDKILKETFPKSIEITTDVPKDLWPISADPTQFHQVMMNLCVNARDAMPNGGALKIHARDFMADENYARMNIEAKAGPYIVIDVTDSGVGIPSEIINRIFEPFFTTKEPGKGTGLGLSTVFRIVKDHGGFVRVYSEVGKGTKFSVYLPAADTTETRHLAKKQIENLPTGHGELILVVDDEVSVREIAKISLVTNGYQAVTANDGAEAIAIYVQKRREIKAVVLDVAMPIMDGPACIRALKKIDPGVKIILVSGLKDNSNLVKVENTDIAAFLTKPYTTETLLKTLKEVLTA